MDRLMQRKTLLARHRAEGPAFHAADAIDDLYLALFYHQRHYLHGSVEAVARCLARACPEDTRRPLAMLLETIYA